MGSGIPKPYVGAYLGVFDPTPEAGHTWDDIPSMYNSIRFDAVDILHLGHCVATQDGHFSVGTRDGVVLNNRFESIVKIARWMKPDIKILAEQFYGGGEGFDDWDSKGQDYSTEMVKTYSDSVRDFLKTWQDKGDVTYKGKTISMRLDGYNIDHEGTVIRKCTKDVLSQVRSKLDQLTKDDPKKRPFIVGITPAWATNVFLDQSMAQSCDFVHMQRYSGGTNTEAADYLKAIPGLSPAKITYGLEIETLARNAAANNTIDKIVNIAKNSPTVVKDQNGNGIQIAGIWTWRLGSNWVFENLMQVWLYNLVRGTKLEINGQAPNVDTVKTEWKKGGGAS